MKNLKSFKLGLIALILVLQTFTIFVGTVPTNVYDEDEIDGLPSSNRVYWSNYSRRFYIFGDFGDLDAGLNQMLGYAYSFDGDSWTVRQEWTDVPTFHGMSYGYWDVYMNPSGQYGYVGGYALGRASIHFRRFNVTKTGGLVWSWGVGSTTMKSGFTGTRGFSILEDDTGRIWSVYGQTPNTIYVVATDRTNGTWEDWLDLSLELILIDDGVPNPSNVQIPYASLDRMTGGKIAITSCWGDVNPLYKSYSSLYHGTGNTVAAFKSNTLILDIAATGNFHRRFDTVAVGDILHAVYCYRQGGDASLRHKEWNYTDAGYGAAFEINDTMPDSSMLSPHISATPQGNLTVMFQYVHNDNDHWIYYRRRLANGTWEASGQYLYNGTYDFDWDKFSTTEDYNSPIGIAYQDGQSDPNDIWFDFLGVLNPFPASLLNVSWSENHDGWIYEGEVYSITAYFNNCDAGYLNFTDSVHQIELHFNNRTRRTWGEVDPNDQFTCDVTFSNFTWFENNISKVIWTFVPSRNIVDYNFTDIDYFIENDEYAFNQTGDTGLDTGIYNLGGFTWLETTNSTYARIIDGGDTFELMNPTAGDDVNSSAVFRKLQWIHTTFSWDLDLSWFALTDSYIIATSNENTNFLYAGIQYRLNGTWVDGWGIRVHVEDGSVGSNWFGNDASWIALNVTFYEQGTKIDQEVIIVYNHGYDKDYMPLLGTQHVRLWFDFWFNRMNSSSVVGARVTPYYNGMVEVGSAWWFGYGEFRPYVTNTTEGNSATCFMTLRDGSGNQMSAQEIELVRYYMGLDKNFDIVFQDWKIWDYRLFNIKTADDRMMGIDTPIFVEPEDISMPKGGGFLSPLYRAIEGISTSIWRGALSFTKILWGAMDWFISWTGIPTGFFSRILELVMLIPNFFIAVLNNVVSMAQSMVTYLSNTLVFVVQWFPRWVTFAGWFTQTVIYYWTNLVGLFTGQIIPNNIFNNLDLGAWIRFGMTLVPFFEVLWICFDDDPAGRTQDRIGFYQGLLNGTINFIKGLIGFLQSLIATIRHVLPF